MFKSKRNSLRQSKVYTPQDIGHFLPETQAAKGLPKHLKIIIVFLVLLTGLSYLFFYSPVFKIKNVLIDGLASNQELEGLKGKNILFISSGKIKGELEKNYPELNIVQISRGLPDTLRVKLDERQSSMLWQTRNKDYLVDNSGIIYKEVDGVSDLLKIKDNKDLEVTLNKPVVTENFINFLNDVNSNFNQSTNLSIDHYEINETIFQIDAVTNLGWKIIFDVTRSGKDQLADLSQFLKDHQSEIKDYVDIRVEGRVYYK